MDRSDLKTMDPIELLEAGAISLRLRAQNKRQVLAALADISGRVFGLPPAGTLDALIAREASGSTGVGHGVALPHARLGGLTLMRGVFVRLETPVPFDAIDEQPVDLLFALFAPMTDGSEHLRALARVSRLLRRTELRQQLRQARTADAVQALLSSEASIFAA